MTTNQKTPDKNKIKRQKVKETKKRYKMLSPHLSERSKRLYAGTEALSLGHGGIEIVSEATGFSRTTVPLGCKEVRKGEPLDDGEVRRAGGGRLPAKELHPGLLEELGKVLDSNTCGDPEDLIQWTHLSTRVIAELLAERGFPVSHTVVHGLLEEQGYSLQGNKKAIEGESHADRDAQFKFINRKSKRFIKQGKPLVSVDCKKKENHGLLKNEGRVYRRKKQPLLVNGHDFPDKEWAKSSLMGYTTLRKIPAWSTSASTGRLPSLLAKASAGGSGNMLWATIPGSRS